VASTGFAVALQQSFVVSFKEDDSNRKARCTQLGQAQIQGLQNSRLRESMLTAALPSDPDEVRCSSCAN